MALISDYKESGLKMAHSTIYICCEKEKKQKLLWVQGFFDEYVWKKKVFHYIIWTTLTSLVFILLFLLPERFNQKMS